jgi:SAM-dependent methyltransferase
MPEYVHGYSPREAERLRDQATTIQDHLHHDTRYPDGALVLEPGCGIGAQTVILARNSPGAEFHSIELSADSAQAARDAVAAAGLTNVTVHQADIFNAPFNESTFDHMFICFVLEHLADPHSALVTLRRLLKPGGTVTVSEGEHGSCFWHPETPASRAVWQCLIDVQAGIDGESLMGRRLYPLLSNAGFHDVHVSPRNIYCDASNPALVDGFVRKTIIPMVDGVRDDAVRLGMLSEAEWRQGIADLYAVADSPDGTFIYTFFKAVGMR